MLSCKTFVQLECNSISVQSVKRMVPRLGQRYFELSRNSMQLHRIQISISNTVFPSRIRRLLRGR